MWESLFSDVLWRNALAVVPLAVVVVVVCRWLPTRPATRHALWLVVLMWLIMPPVLPALNPPLSETSISAAELRGLDTEPQASAYAESQKGDEPTKADGPRGLKPAARHTIGKDALGSLDTSEHPQPRGLSDAVAGSAALMPECLTETSQESSVGSVDAGVPSFCGRSRTGPRSPRSLARATGPVGSFADYEVREVLVSPEVSAEPMGSIADVGEPALPSEQVAFDLLDSRTDENDEAQSGEMLDRVAIAALPVRLGTIALTEDGGGADGPLRGIVGTPTELAGVSESDARAVRSSEPAVVADEIRAASPWRIWIGDMLAVRDAVGRAQPIPTGIWVFGIVVFVLAKVAGVLRFKRYIRFAEPAPAPIRELVAGVAGELGLRRLPETLLLDRPISPVVCCGRRPRLLLPKELWLQFDEASRRAVICHELAHLRRRDHWVRWVELAIGGLYWWNPVVWWIRHRVRIEAEYSCDAWVTWLLPRGRRAYAQALLLTKQYVADLHQPAPAVGVGIAEGRAGLFGRRLTMVMTQTMKPRLSGSGIVLALALALVGWVAVPAQSCPTEKAEGKVPAATTEVVVEQTETTPAKSYRLTGTSSDEDDLEERIARLEAKLEKLNRQLERLSEQLERQAEVMVLPQVPRMPAVPLPAPHVDVHRYAVPGLSGKGESISTAYSLSSGKLEALTDLMVRDDVPVLVSPGSDRIQVHGTPDQHQVFKRFVKLISGTPGDQVLSADGEPQEYPLPPGKLEALTELMVRSDVPVLVRPGEDHIAVYGSKKVRKIFGAFVKMIAPGAGHGHSAIGAGPGAQVRDEYVKRQVDRAKRQAEREARKVERKAERIKRKAKQIKRKAEDSCGSSAGDCGDCKDCAKSAKKRVKGEVAKKRKKVKTKEVYKGDTGDVVIHAYVLPEGKLKDLTTLMIRPDVPVLVSPGSGQIDLHGTPHQHAVFNHFVKLIRPEADSQTFVTEGEPKAYYLPPGKLDALTELMSRPDVPVLVRPGEDHIAVYGGGKVQKIFGAFVEIIAPEMGHSQSASCAGCDGKACGKYAEKRMKGEVAKKHKKAQKAKKAKKMQKQGKGASVVHAYVLPEGKLQALTELMVRPDVPILVSPESDQIQVHATQEDQVTFKRFVALINPEWETEVTIGGEEPQVYYLPPGKLKALINLMVRPDVPVLVRPGEDHIAVFGGAKVQKVFGAFVSMIAPDAKLGHANACTGCEGKTCASCSGKQVKHKEIKKLKKIKAGKKVKQEKGYHGGHTQASPAPPTRNTPSLLNAQSFDDVLEGLSALAQNEELQKVLAGIGGSGTKAPALSQD